MSKERNLEFKVGIFVLLGLGVLTYFIWSISDTKLFEKGKSIKVVFGYVNGLKINAPVRIAGVDGGIVRKIVLFFDPEDNKTKAEIDLWISEKSKIPVDSKFTVNQLGLMGEQYVEIFPGINRNKFIDGSETVFGTDPVSKEEMSQKIMDVAMKVETSVTSVNSILSNGENIESVNGMIKNIHSITGNVDDIVANMKSGKGTVGKLLYDEALYDDIQALTSDLKSNPWKLLYKPKDKK